MKKPIKKWPEWSGEIIVGMFQYPGDDDNWWVTPRKMPPKKKLKRILQEMEQAEAGNK
jgi:hypothetical protein